MSEYSISNSKKHILDFLVNQKYHFPHLKFYIQYKAISSSQHMWHQLLYSFRSFHSLYISKTYETLALQICKFQFSFYHYLKQPSSGWPLACTTIACWLVHHGSVISNLDLKSSKSADGAIFIFLVLDFLMLLVHAPENACRHWSLRLEARPVNGLQLCSLKTPV